MTFEAYSWSDHKSIFKSFEETDCRKPFKFMNFSTIQLKKKKNVSTSNLLTVSVYWVN